MSDKCSALDDLESIKETDYPNKRRYNAARTLANKYVFYLNAEYERKLKERCRFILDRADTVLAADYLSEDGKFLYSQAIKDNFKLPISLPDEDETREYAFWEAIRKIAKKDIPLSFEVWKWALERFLPYAEYDRSAYTDLTSSVVHDLYGFPENYRAELVRYMDKNPEFCRRISERACDSVYSYANLLVTAIREELYSTASVIFGTCLEQAHGQWKVINDLTESTIICCKNDKEVESMEFFRDNLFPLVKSVPLGMVQDEVEDWEKKISEYIDRTERGSEKYAYSRRYAWRKSVPDGKEFDLNPLYYETEKETWLRLKNGSTNGENGIVGRIPSGYASRISRRRKNSAKHLTFGWQKSSGRSVSSGRKNVS